MMTLYLAFDAMNSGRISPSAEVTVSSHAASRTGSSLGLRAGDRIAFRNLVLATAVRSANDAATALAEAIDGSETEFVARMNATASRMGLTGTTFRNAHGLTQEGHLSTARDMARLGRFLFFDFPEFYAMFGRASVRIGSRDIAHTNRRFLGGYHGADGIKTGFTRAAGFNLTASARKGDKHLIVSVFGASSSANRAARVGRLMDEGFAIAPATAAMVHPGPPQHRLRGRPEGPLLSRLDGLDGFGAGSVLASAPVERGLGAITLFRRGPAPAAPKPTQRPGAIGLTMFSRPVED